MFQPWRSGSFILGLKKQLCKESARNKRHWPNVLKAIEKRSTRKVKMDTVLCIPDNGGGVLEQCDSLTRLYGWKGKRCGMSVSIMNRRKLLSEHSELSISS